jgi:hypothetical protein
MMIKKDEGYSQQKDTSTEPEESKAEATRL